MDIFASTELKYLHTI